ncbi:replication initiation protein [Clostridium sp. B9]|uniref:replication initiation protein n=1 Tax=Clostridium sp. B9 TaxID=3423224 RepID=UPI003D2F072D
MNLNTERLTKVNNDVLKNVFSNYNVNQIKFFLILLNKAITLHYASSDERVQENVLDCLEIDIPISFINKYKGNKHLTKNEIFDIFESLNILFKFENSNGDLVAFPIIDTMCFYNSENKISITLREEALDYLVLVSRNYTCLDLNFVKDLKGKYEIGLYMLISMYSGLSNKKKFFNIEELKDFFNVFGSNNDLLKYIRKAQSSLINKGFNFQLIPIKNGRTINQILLSM